MIKLSRDRRFGFSIAFAMSLLWATGLLSGMGLAWKSVVNRYKIKENPHLWLALRPLVTQSSTGMPFTDNPILASHEEKITENLRAIDRVDHDNKILHDQIAALQDKMVDNLNTLKGRIDVDEAKIYTVFWVIGILGGILHATQTILAIIKFRDDRDGN